MSTTQSRILELFDTLRDSERQELAAQLYQRARESLLERLTPEQRADLDAGIAEADRGEGDAEDAIFTRLEQRFGVELS